MAPSDLAAGIDTNQIFPHEIRPDVEQAQEASDSQEAQYSVFTKHEKRWIIFLIAMAGFFSPLSANIYFPAINYLARDLSVSLELINLTITAYLICQGIVPSLVGDTADMVGRRPVYIAAFVVYLAANVGLALQDSYAALLVLRILQSSGSSGTIMFLYDMWPELTLNTGIIALAISVVADLAPPARARQIRRCCTMRACSWTDTILE